MTKRNSSSFVRALLLVGALFTTGEMVMGQSILININQANPAAVTFTATVNNSSGNDSSTLNIFGVDLIGYFTSAIAPSSATVSGTLTPNGTSTAYTRWITDSLLNTSAVDLNFYVTSSPQAQTFSTGTPAFTGTATINLSSVLASLPVSNANGQIYSGNGSSPGVVIGRWVVVPEPSVQSIITFGAMIFAGFVLVRRFGCREAK